MQPDDVPTMIDLFSGAGGVTTGFKTAGFKVLAAVEVDPVASQTYRLNHPEVLLYEQDIRNLSPEKIMVQCGLKPGQLTVLSVCAPCQPFSRQNRRRSTDSRATLVLEAVRFAKVLRPQFLFIENVPGLKDNTDILHRLMSGLEEAGYKVFPPTLVDAVNYGVPQFRKRFIMLATSLNVNLQIPEPTHVPPGESERTNKPRWLTVRDALQGLEDIGPGEASATDPLHKARKHSPLSLARLRHIPHNGGSRDSLPPELRLACHNNTKAGYRDVYGRMHFDKPANTLTTGCTNFTKGRFAHPVKDRSITPREAARIQTFPDDYRFCGNYEQISAQIGNAVPPKMAEAFARHFYRLWKGSRASPKSVRYKPDSPPGNYVEDESEVVERYEIRTNPFDASGRMHRGKR